VRCAYETPCWKRWPSLPSSGPLILLPVRISTQHGLSSIEAKDGVRIAVTPEMITMVRSFRCPLAALADHQSDARRLAAEVSDLDGRIKKDTANAKNPDSPS